MTGSAKLLVIGLDGATFEVLRSWAEQGLLPNIASIVASGVSGTLRSTIPPVTAPAWASFQTGKNPGKHGLFHFTRYQQGTYETPIVDANSIGSRTIWQIAGDHGARVGIINVPLTYPPAPVNGFMISGMLTPEPAKGFYPPELYRELVSNIGDYQIFVPVRTMDYLGIRNFVRDVTRLAERRAAAALYMMSREHWDLFMVHFQSTDILQHSLWSYIDPAHPDFAGKDQEEKAYVMGFYKRLDALVGKLLEQAGQRSTVILMSDHGFGPAVRRVYVNRWLMDQGLLAASGGRVKRRAVQLAELMVRKADVLRMRRRLIRPRSRAEGLVNRLTRDVLIDWQQTKAFALSGPFYGRIYLNCRGREAKGIIESGAEKEALRHEIAEGLLALRDPDTSVQIIKEVFKREEIYHGEMLDTMPDLVIEPADGYMITTSFRGDTLVEPVPRFMTGTHRMNGMLILKGKPFLEGTQVQNADIIDLAPTILYVLGVPIPTDMDGRVLIEGVKPSYVQKCPVRHEDAITCAHPEHHDAYSAQDVEEIRERLAGLGYLS